MAVFLAATGPAIAVLARLSTISADRNQTSLKPSVEISLSPGNEVLRLSNCAETEGSAARNCADTSKLTGRLHRPDQPPML